jgi:hypothetical protein
MRDKCGDGINAGRKAGTSMISKSQEETEVSYGLEEWALEAEMGGWPRLLISLSSLKSGCPSLRTLQGREFEMPAGGCPRL